MTPVGYQIARCREARGVTQALLAGRAGLSQPNLSDIEKGKADLTVSTLQRIACALEVPAGAFFEGETADAGPWSRTRLEAVARAVVRGGGRLSAGDRKIADGFRSLMPGLGRSRKSAREIQQAWHRLRRRLPPEVLRALQARIEDEKRRQASAHA